MMEMSAPVSQKPEKEFPRILTLQVVLASAAYILKLTLQVG